MIGRLMGIGGILTGLATGITALVTAHVITVSGLLWTLAIVGMVILAYILSFGYTEFYKRGNVPALKQLDPQAQDIWKRKIYNHAVMSGFFAASIQGVVLFLLLLTGRMPTEDQIFQVALYMVIWLVGAAALGLSSPWVWKLVFEVGLSWVLQKDPALGVEIRRDEDSNVVAIKDHTKPDAQTEFVGKQPGPAATGQPRPNGADKSPPGDTQ